MYLPTSTEYMELLNRAEAVNGAQNVADSVLRYTYLLAYV